VEVTVKPARSHCLGQSCHRLKGRWDGLGGSSAAGQGGISSPLSSRTTGANLPIDSALTRGIQF